MSGVAFLGSDDAAAACLAALADAGLVVAVVTQPARRRARGGEAEPTVVASAAAARGLPVVETADVNAPDALAALTARAPQLLVVVSFGQILRGPVLAAAPLGAVNLHYSLLPRWRGAAPVQRAIEAGDAETGAAVQRVVPRLDAGDVLAVARVPIGPRDDTPALRARLTAAGAPLLLDVVRRLLAGERVAGTPQDEALVTRARVVEKSEGDVDPAADSAAVIERRIRAFEPWPRCRARLVRADGVSETITLREASVEDGAGAAGAVLSADAAGIRVATAAGVLRITRLQRPGGRDMDARAFLNGFPAAPEDRLVRLP